ncbi:hypothetical protein HYU94_02210 [Candidatus Daviesbacteria bacterium]|nr:hypothetical protein [Candidatus Daviesbacteria bacterium]
MNTLINTPLLKTASLKTEFDNKIIVVFLTLVIFLLIAGLLFIDLLKPSPLLPAIESNPPDSTQFTMFA